MACSSNTVTLSRGELPQADYFSPVKLMCALARSYSQEPRYLRLQLIPFVFTISLLRMFLGVRRTC